MWQKVVHFFSLFWSIQWLHFTDTIWRWKHGKIKILSELRSPLEEKVGKADICHLYKHVTACSDFVFDF